MTGIRQVRLGGFGGQGIVLAGFLLGQAGVFDGKYVSGSNSYGAQARGSGCKSEIVFSDAPVDFPHLTTSDILIAMSQGAYDIYCGDVKESSGIIFYDKGFVTPGEAAVSRHVAVPATEVSLKKLKNQQVANILFLGTLIEATRIVSPGAIRKAISMHVSERFRSLNLKALRVGMELGKKLHG